MSKILAVNKRWYPGVGPNADDAALGRAGWGDPVCLCTVLVEGDIGDYAAYQGIGDRPEWIAQNGDKVRFSEACAHFPGGQLEEARYHT